MVNTATETITYPFVETELESVGISVSIIEGLQSGDLVGDSVTVTGEVAAATVSATGAIDAASTSSTGTASVLSATATTAGGAVAPAVEMGSDTVGIYFGSGAPTITAAQGSLYLRTDGSTTSTRLYVNSDGADGWVAFTSAS